MQPAPPSINLSFMISASRALLLRQLRAHRPIDPFEAQALGDLLDLVETHPDPFSRASFTPGHLTASALLLHPDGARLGLIWHEKLGMFLQPGGHLEPGDHSPLHAALRELAEESGLQGAELDVLSEAPLDLDVHPIPAGATEGAHHHFDLRYGLRLRRERPLPLVTWVALEELPEPNLRRAGRKLARLAADLTSPFL